MKSIKIQNKRGNSKVCMKEPRKNNKKNYTNQTQGAGESRENFAEVLQILGRGVVMKISPFAGQGRVQRRS